MTVQDHNEKNLEIIKYQELYINDLEEKIANLTSVIESGKPVCPYCKSELELVREERYYLRGEEDVWKCYCTD
jgi:transposase-like protein